MNRINRARCSPLKANSVYDRAYPHDMRCRVLRVRYTFTVRRNDLYMFARMDKDAHARVMKARFGFRDDPVYCEEIAMTGRLERIVYRTKLQYRFTKRFKCWKNVRDIGERE